MDESGQSLESGAQLVDIENDTTLSVRFTTATQPIINVCTELLEGLQITNKTLEDALFTTLSTAEQGGQVVRLDVTYTNPNGSETRDLGVRIQKSDSRRAQRARSIRDQFTLGTKGWRARQASMPWSRYFNNDIRFLRHRVSGSDGRDRLVLPL